MTDQGEPTMQEKKKEDVFSQLPRDCHISVFRLLNRKTLNELEVVSKQMGEIVTEPVLKRIKTIGTLCLFETGQRYSGHTFQFQSGEYDRQWNNCLRYTVDYGEEEGIRSRVQDGDKVPYRVFKHPVTPGAASPLPRSIWANLSKLNKRHAFKRVLFDRILINDDFVEEFRPLLAGPNYVSLRFAEVLFDKSMNMSKFAEFLFATNTNFLDISLEYQVLPANITGINEKFLTKFAANRVVDLRLSFSLYCGMSRVPFHWTASREFLPVLSRFNSFAVESMKLRPEDFIELIMIRLDSESHGAKWMFSLTEKFTKEHFGILDSTKYTFSKIVDSWYGERDSDDERSAIWYRIHKTGTLKECNFLRCIDATTNEPAVEMQFIKKRLP